jgi:hypothetical protein
LPGWIASEEVSEAEPSNPEGKQVTSRVRANGAGVDVADHGLLLLIIIFNNNGSGASVDSGV